MTLLTTESSLRQLCPAQDLSPAERLLVRSFRVMVFTDNGGQTVARSFRQKLGDPAAHRALGAFFSFVGLLSCNARRPLRIRLPHCGKVSADERTLVALLAALQARRTSHARSLVSWLTPPPAQALAFAYAASLAQGFREGGLIFNGPSVRRRPSRSRETISPVAPVRGRLVVL